MPARFRIAEGLAAATVRLRPALCYCRRAGAHVDGVLELLPLRADDDLKIVFGEVGDVTSVLIDDNCVNRG